MTTPRATGPIRIVPIDEAEAAVWRLAREVAKMLSGLPWVLIGGLMVRIIEAEHGVTPKVTTGDVDTLMDVRMLSTATEEAATRLLAADFEPQRYEGLTYRFIRGDDIVDELPVEVAFFRFGVGPVEADIDNRAGKARLALRAALLAHPALAGVGEERVHFAKLNADDVGLSGSAGQPRKGEQHSQQWSTIGGQDGFHAQAI